MTVDLSKLAFYSAENYMKREDRSPRYQDVTVAAFGSQTINIPHTVGHVPEVDVQAELTQDGMIWTGNLPEVGMEGFYTPAYPQITYWATTTGVSITISNPTGSSATVRVYYLIFKDYA
jgi:hypothetical protein